MRNYIFADWWEDRGDPLQVLDECFTFEGDILEIMRQTEKAVKVRIVLYSRADGEYIEEEWIPKSAFIYADFEEFKKCDKKAIARRVKQVEKNFPEYADELKRLIKSA